jgi:hypothetical protein
MGGFEGGGKGIGRVGTLWDRLARWVLVKG